MMYGSPAARVIPKITEDFLVSIGIARGPLTKKLAGEGTETADIYLRSPFRSWDDKNIVGTALLRAFATVSARQQVMARTPLVWEEYQERAGGMVMTPLLAKECTQDELACARLIHLALMGKEIIITGQYGVRCGEYGGIDDGEPPNLKRASVVFFNSEGLTESKTSYVTKLSRMQDIMVNSRRVTVSGDKWGRGVPEPVRRETIPKRVDLSMGEYVDVPMSEPVNVPMSEYVDVEDEYVDEGMGEYVDVGGIMGDLGTSSDAYFLDGVPMRIVPVKIKVQLDGERDRVSITPKTKAPPKPRTSKGKKQAPVAPPAEPKKERSGYLGRVFSFDLDD